MDFFFQRLQNIVCQELLFGTIISKEFVAFNRNTFITNPLTCNKNQYLIATLCVEEIGR